MATLDSTASPSASKGLHYVYRKGILDKIEYENQKIAKKLFYLKADSLTNKESHDKAFQAHLKYRDNII